MNKKNINRTIIGLIITAVASLGAACSEQGEKQTLNGAGASFPAPVYQSWTHTYSQINKTTQINYQSIGSGAGVNQIKSKTILFAGTDNPLTIEQQEKEGLMQFPMLAGGVVVIVNIPGVKNDELRLDEAALSDIFLGKITKWNDERIIKLNPSLSLPNLGITVVRRADASGTSFIFTNYLSKISEEWKTKVGEGSSVKWPVGIGGQKNPGVCNNVSKISGSIGYTEYTYAIEAKLSSVQLKNKAGNFVKPSIESFIESAGNADWEKAPGFYVVLTNQDGNKSWPITGITYILMRKDSDLKTRKELIKYFNWCFTSGSQTAKKLHYVPLPKNVISLIQKNIFEK